MLMLLPPEVLESICEKLNGCDLKHLSLTSRWVHKATFRQLWRSVTILPRSPRERHCITPFGPPQQCLQSTRELRFEADAMHCVHAHDCLGYMGKWLDKDPLMHDTWEERSDSFGYERGRLVRVKYECLAQRTMAMLRRFDDGELEAFDWSYTTCIPSEVLEYLSIKHPSIQSLSFTTDPFCSRFNRWSRTTDLNLSAFHNIRRFSWKAPMGCHFATISNLVQTNAEHLEELEVNLQSWSRQWEDRETRVVWRTDSDEWDKVPASTMLAREMFGLDFDAATRTCFPKMRSLKLTRVPLRDEAANKTVTAASINLAGLTSLKLIMCLYWTLFLQDMAQSPTPIQVKSLEILDFYLQTPNVTSTKKVTAITDFLDSFNGLEELFISHCGPTPVLEFWKHLERHAPTLKAFVHHQRITDLDEELLLSRNGKDLEDPAISLTDRGIIGQDPTRNPLWRLNLEFIGLTCAPEYLRDILLPFVSKGSLKVLHIRSTGANVGTYPPSVFDNALDSRITDAEQNGEIIDKNVGDNDLDSQSKDEIKISLQYISVAIREREEWKTPPLRQSSRDFADWVFGPDGITSLEYIVAGDLSHGSRYSERNALICRSAEWGRRYRVISQKTGGEEWVDVKTRFGRALEACPVENIVPEYN
ncbi:hypothetical protein FPSE_10825 [Fusarium pseudograminearum CS3096]|uniref:F-box domain-containing protein n=1 Tax=Fusarium pseudograminearum (strain CS3096) TaxID=1028729 RepID=K3UC11_FUSPC|nr:hypothetical protein FPSE_10825 [Fusarium pseudograminearum CS3096]EKJ68981.1 hypothetical protein FPSE_10825 [Fusarium pseudograminearum CS3096]